MRPIRASSSLGVLAFAIIATAAAAQTVTGASGAPGMAPAPSSSDATGAAASSVASPASVEDIVVTARRRNETTLNVPVTVAAISAQQIANAGANSLMDVGKLVPGLIIADNASGGAISLRGVSSATSNTSIEQAVSINVDGIPISYAGVVRLGYMDLGQIEVLKGPQALFFGKNSTGGIIALKSADPTRSFEAKISGGYEFNAHQYLVEGYASGPLTDTLGARLAVRYDDSRGYFHNVLPNGLGVPGVFGPANHYAPGDSEFSTRGTLKWQPNNALQVRLKGSYSKQDGNGTVVQLTYCPNGGVPQNTPLPLSARDDCKANKTFSRGDVNPAIAALDPRMGSGAQFKRIRQTLVSADVSYSLADGVTLTSNTGYFDVSLLTLDDYSAAPRSYYAAVVGIKDKQFSEEVRVSTDFHSAINGMAGLFYQSSKFDDRTRSGIETAAQVLVPNIGYHSDINDETFSAFGQLRWTIMPRLELSGGLRYTHERKTTTVSLITVTPVKDVSNLVTPNNIAFDDFSPEATLSWHPVENTTFYASYKHGYKAGGYQYNSTSVPTGLNNGVPQAISYDKEVVQGFEGGAKALLFDRQLRLDASIYHYKFSGLQVTRFDPITLANTIGNVGNAINKGAELNASFRPRAVPGVSLNGSVGYNSTKYSSFQSQCFTGQTIAEGCNVTSSGAITTAAIYAAAPTAANKGVLQDLTGKRLTRAPAWTGSAGLAYETAVGPDLKLGVDGTANYSSKFFVSQESIPESAQPHYTTIDASIRLGAKNDRWQVSFIARNLTNKYILQTGFQAPGTGIGTTTGTNTTGGRADFESSTTTGRELWIKSYFRF